MFKAIKKQLAYRELRERIHDEGAAINNARILLSLSGEKEGAKKMEEKIKTLHKRLMRVESKMWRLFK